MRRGNKYKTKESSRIKDHKKTRKINKIKKRKKCGEMKVKERTKREKSMREN